MKSVGKINILIYIAEIDYNFIDKASSSIAFFLVASRNKMNMSASTLTPRGISDLCVVSFFTTSISYLST